MSIQIQKQNVPTLQESLVLVKNLLRHSLASICYLRDIFPESSFQTKELLGVRLKALVPKDNESQLFTSWLEQGAFDAIEKGYVRKLLFGIYRDSEGQDVIEQYSFYLEYPSQNAVSLSVQGKRDGSNTEKQPLLYQNCTKENINYEVIRGLLLLTENLKALPNERYLIMRVVYNDRTPLEYTPKHFEDAISSDTSDSSQDTFIGSIITPHHIFRLKINNKNSDNDEVPTPAVEETTTQVMDEETFDERMIEEIAAQIQPLIKADKSIKTVSQLGSFILSQFPRLTKHDIEAIISRLSQQGHLEEIQSEEEYRLKLVKLIIKTLDYLLQKEWASAVALTRDLEVSQKVADSLFRKMKKDGCVSEAIDRSKGGYEVDKQRTKTVIIFAKERLARGLLEEVLRTPMPIPTEVLSRPDEDNKETQLPDHPQLPLAKTGTSRKPTSLSPSLNATKQASVDVLSLSTPLFPDCPQWTVRDALELIHNILGTEKNTLQHIIRRTNAKPIVSVWKKIIDTQKSIGSITHLLHKTYETLFSASNLRPRAQLEQERSGLIKKILPEGLKLLKTDSNVMGTTVKKESQKMKKPKEKKRGEKRKASAVKDDSQIFLYTPLTSKRPTKKKKTNKDTRETLTTEE